MTVATMHFNFHIHQKLPLVWEKQNGALTLFSDGSGLALNISPEQIVKRKGVVCSAGMSHLEIESVTNPIVVADIVALAREIVDSYLYPSFKVGNMNTMYICQN